MVNRVYRNRSMGRTGRRGSGSVKPCQSILEGRCSGRRAMLRTSRRNKLTNEMFRTSVELCETHAQAERQQGWR